MSVAFLLPNFLLPCHHLPLACAVSPTLSRTPLTLSDLRIVPWLALLYLLSFLDRSNIGNANIFGLQKHLNLDSSQYAACLAIFFAFYVLFEVPSNMVMKAWRPAMWLPIIMLAWGIVMIGMGFGESTATSGEGEEGVTNLSPKLCWSPLCSSLPRHH